MLLEKLCVALPPSANNLRAAAASDAAAWSKEFGVNHDPSKLACESNTFRYRPFAKSIVRAGDETSDAELSRILLAGSTAGVALEVSLAKPRSFLASVGVDPVIEDDATFEKRLLSQKLPWQGLRAPGANPALKAAAIEAGLRLVDSPVVWNGRLELLWLLREQSVSETLHRYGNIVPTPEQLGC
jgi:RHH-type proline utilization regulon transcriptional repressor/proline dehydrogenase/delta 1-pyrroline-5-carboxylate dehydrogenase